MKQQLKRIWEILNQPRFIEISIRTIETKAQKKAREDAEYAKLKQEIAVKNYKTLMQERIMPFVRDLELTQSGLLLTDKQIFERAQVIYLRAKQEGVLDALNCVVTPAVEATR